MDVETKWRGIRSAITFTEDMVKRVVADRRYDVLEAYAEGVESYLPPHIEAIPIDSGILYQSDNGEDLVHYFYEGLDMGPNIYWEKQDKWFSPPGKPKHYTGTSLSFSQGTDHWDEVFQSSPDFDEFLAEAQEILRR